MAALPVATALLDDVGQRLDESGAVIADDGEDEGGGHVLMVASPPSTAACRRGPRPELGEAGAEQGMYLLAAGALLSGESRWNPISMVSIERLRLELEGSHA